MQKDVGKPELLRDLVGAARGDSDPAALYTKMRSMITEATRVTPMQISTVLSSVAKRAAEALCKRSASYMIRRIEKHSRLADNELKAAQEETLDLFGEFLTELKTEITRQFVKVENFIFNNIFIIDEELFAEGYIRFRHQEGIDYTRPDEAHALAAAVEAAEARAEAQLMEVKKTRERISDIDSASSQLDELIEWLDAAITSDLYGKAIELSETADQVQNKMLALRSELDS